MKILQLCHKSPIPPVDGGCIAMHNVTDGLLKCGQDVKVLALETPKHPIVLESFSKEYLLQTRFESVYVDTTPRLKEAIRFILRQESYHVRRFYSNSVVSTLIQIFSHEEFDIIHLESIYMTPYIPVIRKHSKAKIVVRLHNIEHQIWERLSENERNLFKKMVFRANSRQLRAVESQFLQDVDGYMTISSRDYDYFHAIAPKVRGTVLPFGLDIDNYEPMEDYIPTEEPSLFHLGSMNWSPNVEGIEWFLEEVWPLILEHHPTLMFEVAGHDIPEHIAKRKDPHVLVVGPVPSANDFMSAHDIMVVPLLSGSGIRVKIVEAMALGKVVVTTSVGAEGLAVENGKHLFIADTPEEFLAVIDKCIATPDICTIIGENARDFISVYHNNRVIMNHLLDYYRQIISEGR